MSFRSFERKDIFSEKGPPEGIRRASCGLVTAAAAAVVVVVAAVVAAAIAAPVHAAAPATVAEQQDQDDDPPNVAAEASVITAHKFPSDCFSGFS